MSLGRHFLVAFLSIYLVACGGGDDPPPNNPPSPPQNPGPDNYWSETAVRKILHTFAYGGQATDAQIKTWAGMEPRAAIQQILTFDAMNPLLSPPQDNTAEKGGTLQALMDFWGGTELTNPAREDLRVRYPTIWTNPNTMVKSTAPHTMQNTWTESINKRGLNPFRQKVGLFLTNYHMAVSTHAVRPMLIRSMYDEVMNALEIGMPFQDILSIGASSAAVAFQYGHRANKYNNDTSVFTGNDDFAREFHQLFFRILGEDYAQDYHENTTIEHTAWILTGMEIDRDPMAWGLSDTVNDYWTDKIIYTDHEDAYRLFDPTKSAYIYNFTKHRTAGLEILGTTITGANAGEKINNLAQVAINERESLDAMPVFIINFFADDNLNAEKTAEVRDLWRSVEPKNLLTFLQEYAISPTFHREDTYKYKTAFNRNLAIFNLNTVDNEEAYKNSWTPIGIIRQQGAQPFAPAHDVFGGQTSINAANNPDIFKSAYNVAVNSHWAINKYIESYPPIILDKTWEKDWARVLPKNNAGVYRVNEVGEWLWQRFVADGLKNYGPLERAYVNGFLAAGADLGWIIDDTNPDVAFTSAQLETEPYRSYIQANESVILKLESSDINQRRVANSNVGLAINFISMTPYVFAMEGR